MQSKMLPKYYSQGTEHIKMEKTTSYFNYAGLLEFMYLKHDNTDLCLSHCGMQQCTPRHSYGHTARPEYHLHFILDGQGYYEIHGKTYSLKRGQIFVVPPGVSSYFYQADQEKPWYYAWIAFNGTRAEYLMSQAGFDQNHVVRSANIPPEEFTELIYEMLRASQLTVANELDRAGYLYLIMSLLIESNKPEPLADKHSYSVETYIKHALQYIQFNYNRNINVQDIVSYVGINRSYFTYIFSQRMNISPKEYLQQFRIQKAKTLLWETATPIAEIALKVGYKDPFIFSKNFKKLEGISPREYRDQSASKTD